MHKVKKQVRCNPVVLAGPTAQGGIMKTILISGKNVVIDEDDYSKISTHNWLVRPSGYVVSTDSTPIYLHRLINNTHKGCYTDHINRNKLDNRKCNLREVTPLQSQTNVSRLPGKSGFVGVKFEPRSKCHPWIARIKVFGKFRNIGVSDTPEGASEIYKAFANVKTYSKFNIVNECCSE